MLKLLAIEDDAKDLIALRSKLVGHFEVSEAHTLPDAKRVMDSKQFDAVLIDVGLRDTDRHGLVEEVKKEAKGAAIIVLSAYQDTAFMQQAISRSASYYLVKGRDYANAEYLRAVILNGINLSTQVNQCNALIDEIKKEPPKLISLPWLAPVAAALFALTCAAATYDTDMSTLFAIDRWIEAIANQ